MNTKEKFKALMKAVEDQPDELFNMDYFGIKEECGTACCALGAFAQSEAGKSLGLSLDIECRPAVVRYSPRHDYEIINYQAGAEALGIDQKQAERMFNPDTYSSEFIYDGDTGEGERIPKEAVLDRIDEIAREEGLWD
jgi:hypothetical protein